MSTYKNFVIAGVGNVGMFIARELLKQKSVGKANEITILTHKGSTNDTLDPLSRLGAKIITVDYESVASLASALVNVDVVVCTLGYAGIRAAQFNLASAARVANVRLYVPSEFGLPNRPVIPTKMELQEKLGNIDMAIFLVGSCPEVVFKFADYAGLILEKGTATVAGDGKLPTSFTTREDIGRFVAYVLTTLPPSKLANKTFRIEGQRISFSEIIDEYQRRTRRTLKVTHIPVEDLEKRIHQQNLFFPHRKL